MKCPFCAEDIQDAAILCRFCGAENREGQWYPPPRASSGAPRRKGALTIKSAGVLFLISGAFGLLSVTSEVPLFGAMRGGLTAVCYNLLFTGLYVSIGIGLLVGKPWGYQMVFAGTLLYSADKLLFVLDKNTRDAYWTASGLTKEVEALLGIDTSMFDALLIIIVLTMVACWWGFAFYIHLRRDYFHVK